jgi:hypothetical protein
LLQLTLAMVVAGKYKCGFLRSWKRAPGRMAAAKSMLTITH